MSFVKSQLDTMMNKHYAYLLTVGSNIVQRDRRHKNEHYDLVAETYEILYERFSAGKEYIKEAVQEDDDFIRLCCRTMKNLKKWKNDVHNKSLMSTGQFLVIDHEPISFQEQLDIELGAEPTNQETKDYIKDINSSSVPTNRVIDYIKIVSISESLPTHERHLYNEALVNGKSSRTIAREVSTKMGESISYNTVNRMINKLKLKIKRQL